MSDIVERLHEHADAVEAVEEGWSPADDLCSAAREAADEIESLRSRLADMTERRDEWIKEACRLGGIAETSQAERALLVTRAENAEVALEQSEHNGDIWCERASKAEAALVEAESSAEDLRWVLRSSGFRECDIAACNCGSWHQVFGWPERFREIDDATEGEWRNGETLLARVQRILARLAEADAMLMDALPAVQSHIRKHQRSWEAAMKRGDEFHTRKHCEQMNKDLALEARIDAHLARKP